MEASKDDRLENLSNELLIEMIVSIRKILRYRPKIEKNIVVNKSYGGFEVSDEGIELYKKILLEKENCDEKELEGKIYAVRIGENREDPILIEVIEKIGDKVNDECSKLKIEKIFLCPGEDYYIHEDDGFEYICTRFE